MGSRTQLIFAMSSGESELYAIGTAASEALHVKNFLLEAKVCRGVRILINTDSSAGKSMATRFGVSKKTRHVELRFLFLQHLIAANILKLNKISGVYNRADIFTKYVSAEVLQRHLAAVGLLPRCQYFVLNAIFENKSYTC